MGIIGLVKGFFIAVFVLMLVSAVPIFIMSNSIKSTLLQTSFYQTQLESMNAYQKVQALLLDTASDAFPTDQLSTYGITKTELRTALAKQITEEWVKNESSRMLNSLLWFLFFISMFLAWAIGGEPGFGKWRRGALLAIPMSVVGFIYLPWYMVLVQAVALLGLYQGLFYGKAIALVYDQKKVALGWLCVSLNGILIGLTNLILAIDQSFILGVGSIIACTLGFVGVVLLSNEPKFKPVRDWMTANLPWKFKDCWFVCEGIMGLIIALCICRWVST